MKQVSDIYLQDGKLKVRLGRRIYFFEDPQPSKQQLITIDLDLLGSPSPTEIPTIPRNAWRQSKLNDLLDLGIDIRSRLLSNYFSMAELISFFEDQLPESMRQLKQFAEITEPHEAVQYSPQATRQITKIFESTSSLSRSFEKWQEANQEIIDKEIASELEEAPFSVDRYLKALQALKTSQIFTATALQLLQKVEPHEIEAVVLALSELDFFRYTRYDDRVWKLCAEKAALDTNVSDHTIDITNAIEVIVTADYYSILNSMRAKRVGRIVPGRTALFVFEKPGTYSQYDQPDYVIAADRKIKFKLAKTKRIRKAGNWLVIEKPDSLHASLVKAEEIELLAQVNPSEAIIKLQESVAHVENLEEIEQAAAQASDDYRYRRVLADLLIDEMIGLDADVARSMLRNQSSRAKR